MVNKAMLIEMRNSVKNGVTMQVEEDASTVIMFALNNGISYGEIISYYMLEYNKLREMLIRRGDIIEVGVGLKKGDKIAYKKEASLEKIELLKKKGMSNWRIGNELGVSQSTIYRRLKESK